MLSYFKSPFFQKCHSKVTIELGLIDPSAGHPDGVAEESHRVLLYVC